MNELKRGAMLSYASVLLTTAIGLLLTPFIIGRLGDSEYGLYILIGAMVAYLAVLDFGFGNAIVRYVSSYRTSGDWAGMSRFLSTTGRLYCITTVIALACGLILLHNMETIFPKLANAELGKARIMFALMLLNLCITLFGGIFTGIASAYERFVFPRTVTIARYAVRAALIVCALLAGGGAIEIVVIDTAVNLASMILIGSYVRKNIGIKFNLRNWDAKLARDVGSYSFWIFVFLLVSQFQWQSGQVVLGRYVDTEAVAIYGVGVMLGTYYGAFSAAISSVFIPRASAMVAKGQSSEEITDFAIRVGRISFFALALILSGFLLFGRQFIDLWVGPKYADSYLIASTIMLAYTVPLIQSFANSILEARRKFAFKAGVYAILLPAGVGLGVVLLRPLGPVGMALGISAGWVAAQLSMNVYYQKVLGLDMQKFFSRVVVPLLPAIVLSIMFGSLLDVSIGQGWMGLLFKILLFSSVFVALAYRLVLNTEERSLVLWPLGLAGRQFT